jgi:hypothetical protein
MDADTKFRINEPGVISEVIEGEAIVLNFASGTYYSMNHSLQLLWDGVNRGLSRAQVEALFRERYADAGDNLAEDIDAALEQLVAEQLLVVADAAQATDADEATEEAADDTPAYETPVLQKYTDLQELLLLDPIHDVDETGRAITGA